MRRHHRAAGLVDGAGHHAPLERISTGIARLDGMFGGKGFFRGSTMLIRAPPARERPASRLTFVDAACRRGERCLCFLFEESPQQLLRNMRSIGIDLEPWVTAGLLQFHADRPSRYGLETHLATMHQRRGRLQAVRRRSSIR